MGRFRDEDWAEAKRRCRLSAEEVRMARALGLNPRKLSRHVPSPSQPWKLPVGQWVRKLYGKSHATPPSERRRPPRRAGTPAPEPELFPFGNKLETFEDDTSWLDREPTEREIADEDRGRLRRHKGFRTAADYVAGALAGLDFVRRVVLFGSVAQPPQRETPRQRRYREAGALLWHESKDVDLAVWVNEASDMRALQQARSRALNDLLRDRGLGVAHHQVDVFLFEPGTDRYLGRLCHFAICPKHKPECGVEGCGAVPFLRQHENFVFDPHSLERGSVVLFDRVRGLPPPALNEDDLPFLKAPRPSGRETRTGHRDADALPTRSR